MRREKSGWGIEGVGKNFFHFLGWNRECSEHTIDFNSNSVGQWLMIISLRVPVQPLIAPSENNPPTRTPQKRILNFQPFLLYPLPGLYYKTFYGRNLQIFRIS